jgi:hypothetical protein
LPSAHGRFRVDLWTWVAGGVVKLRWSVANVLIVLLPTQQLTSLIPREQSLWWHLFIVVPPLLVPRDFGTLCAWLLLLPTAVGKPVPVLLFPSTFCPRPSLVPSSGE